MLLRAFVAASLALVPTPAAAPPSQANSIPVVYCPVKGGAIVGSAVRIGPNLLLSVNHVTHFPDCYIGANKIKVVYSSPNSDFSIISDGQDGPYLKVDCGGFVAGRTYIAIGHPRGVERLVGVPMTATGQTVGGLAILVGIFTAQPGMSGGAIVDAETFSVVGMVNTADWQDGTTGSVELKGTSVCRGAQA